MSEWKPINEAPKEGRIYARDADGMERFTWLEFGDWFHADGWRETEDRQEYQCDERWEPVEFLAAT